MKSTQIYPSAYHPRVDEFAPCDIGLNACATLTCLFQCLVLPSDAFRVVRDFTSINNSTFNHRALCRTNHASAPPFGRAPAVALHYGLSLLADTSIFFKTFYYNPCQTLFVAGARWGPSQSQVNSVTFSPEGVLVVPEDATATERHKTRKSPPIDLTTTIRRKQTSKST
jgi:hypothetical protein